MTIVYTATQDLDARNDDPRTWDDTVTIRVFQAARGLTEESEPMHAADEVFARLLEAGADVKAAARGAARYARLSGEGIGHVEVRTIHGYSKSDWWDVVAYGPDADAVHAAAEQFSMWLRGDVWVVTAWREKTCDMGETHREFVDCIGGVYAADEDEAIACAYYVAGDAPDA